MPALYVDADACPVKEAVINAAIKHNWQVFMVCNGGVRPHAHPLIQLVIVPADPDAADIWIAERAGPGDIIITNDIPLAETTIHAGAVVLKPNGTLLDKNSIGAVAATRDLMSDIRASDPFHISKSKPFTAKDKAQFSQKLHQLLQR